MEETKTFLDELLLEADNRETKQTQSYYDLILMEIGKLQLKVEENFAEAEKEVELIKEWALKSNSKLQDKIDFLAKKLEAYLREENLKTLELPHGTLKIRKQPDKVEISDLTIFIENASADLVRIIPEEVKPDLLKIKAFIKNKNKVPEGVKLIPGAEHFSYSLINNKEKKNGTEKT